MAVAVLTCICVVVDHVEILIKFIESRVAVSSAYTNVIRITIPKNGGHFDRRAAIGWRNMPLNSYITVLRAQ